MLDPVIKERLILKKSICVYCGSSAGNDSSFRQLTYDVGRHLAQNKIRLVYGGGNVGLMGILADSCLENGGEVLGIIPKQLVEWEVAHAGLTELKIVNSMHERKALMESESDAFLALPGGLGTLDELFEILTWKQLKLHSKPISLINSGDFFKPLLNYIEGANQKGFVSKQHQGYLEAFSSLENWQKGFSFYTV